MDAFSTRQLVYVYKVFTERIETERVFGKAKNKVLAHKTLDEVILALKVIIEIQGVG